jgi:hypothetical protein
MLKNANGGEGTNNKDSQQLIKLIKDTGFEQFYELAAKEGDRMPATSYCQDSCI